MAESTPNTTPNTNKPFQFNLIPPKAQVIVDLEEERDDSIKYAIMLLVIAFLVYGGLLAAQWLLINPRVEEVKEAVRSREQIVESYAEVRRARGELFIKSETLAPLLELNLDPKEIFRVTDAIVAGNHAEDITSYGRESGGVFVFSVLTPSFRVADALLEDVMAIGGVSEVFTRSLTNETRGRRQLVNSTMEMQIDAIGE